MSYINSLGFVSAFIFSKPLNSFLTKLFSFLDRIKRMTDLSGVWVFFSHMYFSTYRVWGNGRYLSAVSVCSKTLWEFEEYRLLYLTSFTSEWETWSASEIERKILQLIYWIITVNRLSLAKNEIVCNLKN